MDFKKELEKLESDLNEVVETFENEKFEVIKIGGMDA